MLSGNITRFLPSLPGYIYARRGDSVYVNLFVGSTADIPLDAGTSASSRTRAIRGTATSDDGDAGCAGTLHAALRIPGWARNEASPGDLYRFADTVSRTVTLTVNGGP